MQVPQSSPVGAESILCCIPKAPQAAPWQLLQCSLHGMQITAATHTAAKEPKEPGSPKPIGGTKLPQLPAQS
jgi:hypothetical protein